MFHYINSNNKKAGFSPVIGEKWSEWKPKMKNDVIESIFSVIDNGDDIIQTEEVNLLRKLLSIADNLIKEKANDNLISDEEGQKLLEQIKNNTINIEELRKEAAEEAKKEPYPNAVDITQELNINNTNGYDIRIFKTNTQTGQMVMGHDKDTTYNTYLIKFKNPKSNTIEEIKIHFSAEFTEHAIAKMIKQLTEGNYCNVLDLMSQELNDVYVNPPKDRKKVDKTKNKQYSEVQGSLKPGGYYRADNDSITLFASSNNNLDLGTAIHELGHAKDHKVYYRGRVNQKLFDLITEIEPKKSNQNYFLTTVDELYAELFKNYAHLKHHISETLEQDYSNILNKLPPDAKEKFLQEVVMSHITEDDMTLESILERAGLSEYKDNLKEFLDNKINIKNTNYLEATSQYNKIKKYAKKNPQILTEFHKTMREIAYDFNHPEKAVKRAKV